MLYKGVVPSDGALRYPAFRRLLVKSFYHTLVDDL